MKFWREFGIVTTTVVISALLCAKFAPPPGSAFAGAVAAALSTAGAYHYLIVRRLRRSATAELERAAIASRAALEASEERFRSVNDALKKTDFLNLQKTRFLASMSHELRTPIGAILGYSEVLEDERALPSERNQALSSIRRNGEHVLELVDDLLDLSKIEAGKLEIEVLEFTLEKVLKDVLSVMAVKAQGKGVRLDEVYLNLIPARIISDPSRIRQVLINLVGNAVKFTERGLVTIALSHTALDQNESSVEFRVQDTGIGIPSEKLVHLFKPFQQLHADPSHKYGGTGLGLAISKEIARLLGGDIEVRSDAGLGSLFTFSIRCKLPEGTPMLRRPSSAVLDDGRRFSPRGEPLPPQKVLSGQVLVVDDSQDNRKLFRYHLEAAGLQVELAENGTEGVRKAVSRSFDMILMDIQMPELDGFGALKQIRANGVKTPIVALTAHAMKGDRERCLSAGFDDYLAKPVSRSSLLCKVAEFTASTTPTDPPPSETDGLEPIIAMFLAALPGKADELEKARKAGDVSTVRLIVHTLKGTAGSMGFEGLADLVARVYAKLEESDDASALAAVEEIENACRAEGKVKPVVPA